MPVSLVSKLEERTIQGAEASDIEWRVAVVLERLGLDYKYQFALRGGRTRRGGIVLDFKVYTTPLPTPLDIRGDYWHQPNQRIEDDLGLALALQNDRYALPVIIYGAQLQTMEQAYSTVKRELRV